MADKGAIRQLKSIRERKWPDSVSKCIRGSGKEYQIKISAARSSRTLKRPPSKSIKQLRAIKAHQIIVMSIKATLQQQNRLEGQFKCLKPRFCRDSVQRHI